MDAVLSQFLNSFPTLLLVVVIAVTLYTLGKGADLLVEEAVSLSIKWGIPKLVIGATIVSLGTTLPEASVSVLAAINGNPDLALGNSVGSIIADTALILGLAAMIGTLPVDRASLNRQGRMQIGAAFLLVIVSLPFFGTDGKGNIHQFVGFAFLILLAIYIIVSIKWAKKDNPESEELQEEKGNVVLQLIKLVVGIAVIIISSKILIPSVEITATRIGIPQSIIAATLVAFGTSLPELITAITAVRKGHGELAIGNILGADILNVLFVTGAAASFTKSGLEVPTSFYILQFPAMLVILIVFRIFAKTKEDKITKLEGGILFFMYLLYLVFSYLLI